MPRPLPCPQFFLSPFISALLFSSLQYSGACPNDYPDRVCRSNTSLEAHDPPLLYNLHEDPGELNELDPDEYADVLEQIDEV